MTKRLRDAALAYAKRGWPIFPVRADKTPYTAHGAIDATTNLEQIDDWWSRWPGAAIGLNVGDAGMMALDFDPGSSLDDLREALGGFLPDTLLKARTPRGGEHWYYALDPHDPPVALSASKLAKNVDVRSFHSYTILPPSVVGLGGYEWLSEGKPAFRTPEMLEKANVGRREQSSKHDEWIIEPDLPENVDAAVKWLRHDARISVEGVNGDSTAYATAAHLKSHGISEALAIELMWEHWNPRCDPPWSADEYDHLAQKVENGYRYNTSPPGNITNAYHIAKQAQLFKPIETPLPKEAAAEGGREFIAGKFRFANRGAVEHIRPPKWLIEDFIPEEGYVILYGPSGTFKTFVALDIAMTVATGGNWPWSGLWLPERQGKVLFVVGEGRPNFRQRIQAWEKRHWGGRRVAEDHFTIVDPVPLINGGRDEWDAFIAGALEMSPDGYDLVAVDTVGRAMAGLNENAQEHASKFSQFVELLRRELGCATLAIHHTGHEESTRARGSSVFPADADTVVSVERDGKTFNLSLRMTKQKDAAEWEKPKLLRVAEIDLGDDRQSLVVLPPEPEAPIKHKSGKDARAHQAELAEQFVLNTICVVVAERLKANPLRAWSTSQLADAVATDRRIEISSQMLRRKYLKELRENNASPIAAMFDVDTMRWRYNPSAGK